MNKVVVGAVAAVLIGGAGFGTLVYPQMYVKRELDKAIAALPEGNKLSYTGLKYSLFTDRLDLTGVELVGRDGEDTVTFTLATASLTGARPDRVQRMNGTGLTMRNADDSVHATAETVEMQELTASGGLLGGGATPQTVTLARIAFNDIAMAAAGDKLKLREIEVRDLNQVDKTPLSMTMGMHGMMIEAQNLPDPDARAGLAALGYDKLSLNFDISYVHSPENRHLSIKKLALSGDNVGSLGLAFELGNVDAEVAAASPMGAIAAIQAATLENLELRYEDASLANRMLKLAAQSAGVGEAEMRSSLLAEWSQTAAQSQDSPLAVELLSSLSTFVGNPKSLSLHMKPAKPVPLMQLMATGDDPVAFVQASGMTVSANR